MSEALIQTSINSSFVRKTRSKDGESAHEALARRMSKLAASQTLYSVLGVNRHADNTQIRQAYRHLALATHPDKGGSAGEFLKVVEAFEVLSDAQKRATYDEDLQRTGSQDGRGIQAAADRRQGVYHTSTVYMTCGQRMNTP